MHQKKAILVMVVGDAYDKLYQALRPSLQSYAAKVGAIVKVCSTIPDPQFHRSLLAQKLLLPKLCLDYDVVAFFDLDICISPDAENIFTYLPVDRDFAAVLDDRENIGFKNAWKAHPRILAEKTSDYFESRNFEKTASLQGSINGGVFVFRPEKIYKLFEDYYYSNHRQGELNAHEEAPMAYLTQTKDIFASLPKTFNTQLFYELNANFADAEISKWTRNWPKFIVRKYLRQTKYPIFPSRSYKNYARKLLKTASIVHFSGKYPIIR